VRLIFGRCSRLTSCEKCGIDGKRASGATSASVGGGGGSGSAPTLISATCSGAKCVWQPRSAECGVSSGEAGSESNAGAGAGTAFASCGSGEKACGGGESARTLAAESAATTAAAAATEAAAAAAEGRPACGARLATAASDPETLLGRVGERGGAPRG
jgi:hypothetical protein